MENQISISTDFLNIRRILALIAYADHEIDDEEREFLASNIGSTYELNDEQLQILLEDAKELPSVVGITQSISNPEAKKLLITELPCLALAKNDWDLSEKEKAIEVIEVMSIPEKAKENILKIFDLIIETKKIIDFAE